MLWFVFFYVPAQPGLSGMSDRSQVASDSPNAMARTGKIPETPLSFAGQSLIITKGSKIAEWLHLPFVRKVLGSTLGSNLLCTCHSGYLYSHLQSLKRDFFFRTVCYPVF